MLDNPLNAGFPTYWHARGYGLFAANPLGQAVFSNGKETLNFTIQPKQSATFRYRLVILDSIATTNQVETRASTRWTSRDGCWASRKFPRAF
jgi:hypothetical protein